MNFAVSSKKINDFLFNESKIVPEKISVFCVLHLFSPSQHKNISYFGLFSQRGLRVIGIWFSETTQPNSAPAKLDQKNIIISIIIIIIIITIIIIMIIMFRYAWWQCSACPP